MKEKKTTKTKATTDHTITIDDIGFGTIPDTNNGDRVRFHNNRRDNVTVTIYGLFGTTTIGPIAPNSDSAYQSVTATNAKHEIEIPAAAGPVGLKGTIKVGTGGK